MVILADVLESELGQRNSTSQLYWFNRRTNMLYIGGNPDATVAGQLADHELSHFALHCATPYGLVLEDLCHMQTQLVLGFCCRFGVDVEGQQIPRPLNRFIRKYGHDLELLESHYPNLGVLSSLGWWFIRPWSHSLFLENALEGEGPASGEGKTDVDACDALAEYEQYFLQDNLPWPILQKRLTEGALFGGGVPSKPFYPLKSMGERGLEPTMACYRMSFPRAKSIPLGGFDLFEGVAFLLEGLKGRGEEIAELINNQSGQRYFSAWSIFLMRHPDLKQVNEQSKYYQLVRAFFALAELSLYVPIGPVYGRLRHEMCTWLDIQPFYRFISALNVLRPNEWLCSESGLDQLQNSVCDRLSWPKPIDFLKLGSKIQYDSPSYVRHREACKIRLKHPWCFVRDLANDEMFEKFFADNCPLLSTPSGVVSGVESQASASVRHFMSKITWRIMFQENYIWTEDLIPKFTLNEVDNRKGDLEMMLNAFPFLKAECFTVVKGI